MYRSLLALVVYVVIWPGAGCGSAHEEDQPGPRRLRNWPGSESFCGARRDSQVMDSNLGGAA
jgi:hypothetical protein